MKGMYLGGVHAPQARRMLRMHISSVAGWAKLTGLEQRSSHAKANTVTHQVAVSSLATRAWITLRTAAARGPLLVKGDRTPTLPPGLDLAS